MEHYDRQIAEIISKMLSINWKKFNQPQFTKILMHFKEDNILLVLFMLQNFYFSRKS